MTLAALHPDAARVVARVPVAQIHLYGALALGLVGGLVLMLLAELRAYLEANGHTHLARQVPRSHRRGELLVLDVASDGPRFVTVPVTR